MKLRGIIIGHVAWLLFVGNTPGESQLATNILAATGSTNRSPEQFSLADAKRLAFERNWDLLAAQSGVNLASAQLLVTREFPNPTVALSTAKIGTHDNATALGNSFWHRSYDSLAAVSQLLEIGGKRRNRQASARAGVAGARARFFDAKRSLDQGVTSAYVAVLLAEEKVRILDESTRYMMHEAEIAEARYKAGDISDSDKKQIDVNAGQYELQTKAAVAAAVQARITVEVLMGINQPAGNWKPKDSIEHIASVTPPMIETTPGAARPDVLAAAADLRRAQFDLKLQKAMRIPDPTLTLIMEHNPNQPSPPPAEDTIGLGLSFPLPLWNRNRGNIKAAQAAVDQSAIALGKIKAQAVSDIAAAEVAYREASERLKRYQDQIRPQSAKVRESIAYKYEKGGASLLELLEAQRTDNDVRLATAQALADTASAAADLAAARNVLSDSELNPRP